MKSVPRPVGKKNQHRRVQNYILDPCTIPRCLFLFCFVSHANRRRTHKIHPIAWIWKSEGSGRGVGKGGGGEGEAGEGKKQKYKQQSQTTITHNNHKQQSHTTITNNNHKQQSQTTITHNNHKQQSQTTITNNNQYGNQPSNRTYFMHVRPSVGGNPLLQSLSVNTWRWYPGALSSHPWLAPLSPQNLASSDDRNRSNTF
jgi:hypothetical protein